MAKKKKQPERKPIAETYYYLHQGKVQVTSVAVHIDYVKEEISLIDTNPKLNNSNGMHTKQWVFKKRGLEYMAGWIDIINAIQGAIVEASDKLEAYMEQKTKEDAELFMAMQEQSDNEGSL